MESRDVSVNGNGMFLALNASGFVSYGSGLEQVVNGNGMLKVGGESGDEKEAGNLAEEVLEDLEEYWEDINDRLIVSRLVSDSVMKGMVSAVEQEAAEKIASKELELARLKEYLQSHEVGWGGIEDVNFLTLRKASNVGSCGRFSRFPNAWMKHEKMRDEVHALRNFAREQFERAKKEVEFVRASNSMKRIGSSSELLELGEILQEKQSESSMHVDKMLQHLKMTMDGVCTKVDEMLLSSKVSLCELQEERDLSGKLEGMIIDSVLRSLHKEFEDNLRDQNAQYFGNQNVNWLEKFNAVSGLGTQLDAIVKSLSVPEAGLFSHGSLDSDHLHHKAVSNHTTPPVPLFGENGTLDASSIHVAESYDFQQLKHLSNVGLVDYFSNIITKLKRDHESALQQKTEEYFRLKREYLKEKRSFLTRTKEEEFDVLRKKIPEVISKLADFLRENERYPALTNNLKNTENLKHRLDSLLSENCHLRDCLADKEHEVKCLEAKISGADAKSFEHSVSYKRMLNCMENFKSEQEDSCIETSLSEEVYKCALREQIKQISCYSENSYNELLITRDICEIIPPRGAIPAETLNELNFEDSDIESLIMQRLSGIILRETIKDAGQEFNKLYQEVQSNKYIINCLDTKAVEKENDLSYAVEENKKLMQEMLVLETELKQKEKLAMDLSISLSKERERFEQASIELCSLREHARQQQIRAAERNTEFELLRSQHLEALERVEASKMEMQKLNQVLDQTNDELMAANKERNTTLSLSQEIHGKLLSSEVREERLKIEIKMAVNGFSKMFDEFQCRVSEAIRTTSLRMVMILRKARLMYQKKLEKRSADLEKAEAEVDLLGDEVETLLSLLGKIYIALDHYSPILKHYPGITEILELVRRKLSSESTRLT